MSMERLLIAILKSESSFAELYKGNYNNARIEKIMKKFNRLRHRFQKPKIIGEKLYKIRKNENPSRLENEENEKYITELEKELNKRKKYYDRNDPHYYGIRDTINLFDEIDEDYYKPIKVNDAFNNNYIEYESRGEKDKNLSVKGYFCKIIPYFSDMINDHKATRKSHVKATREWKIQLVTQVNFISPEEKEDFISLFLLLQTLKKLVNGLHGVIMQIF